MNSLLEVAMPRRSKARLGIFAATLALALGGLAACDELPTAPDASTSADCIWVDLVLWCAPGT
jgi:hypothetical protein